MLQGWAESGLDRLHQLAFADPGGAGRASLGR